MTKTKSIALGLMLVVTFCQTGQATDGNALLSQCEKAMELHGAGLNVKNTSEVIDAGVCIGKVLGVFSNMLLIQTTKEMHVVVNGEEFPLVCYPNESLNQELLVRVLVRYLQKHPEDLHLHESALMWNAFMGAFPCN